MRTYLKKSLVIIASVAILAYGGTLSDAYVLSGPHVLDLMTKKIGTTKNLLVEQKVALYGNRQEKKPLILQETLRYNFPEQFRSEMQSEHIRRIHVVSKDAALTVIAERIAPDPETKFDLYKDILLYHSPQLLMDKLMLHGVDVSISSLGRFEEKIAYVVGAQYPDESVPQLWIDKDTFIPFRWIIASRRTENYLEALEVRYLDWRSFGRVWYPMRIQFFQNNFLLREINVERADTNVFFSKDLFSIEKLKSDYPLKVDAEPATQTEGLTEVEQIIEDFNKLFE